MKKSLKVRSEKEFLNIQNETDSHGKSSRRDFLKLSAVTAVGMGVANQFAAATQISKISNACNSY